MKSLKLNLLFFLFLGFLTPSCEKDDKGEDGPEPGSETAITKAEYEATLGDMMVYHVDVHAANLDPGPAGADVTWDFSEYEVPSATVFQEAFQCPGEDACSEFPDANRMSLWNGSAGSYDYSILSDNEHVRIGGKSVDEGILTTYGDPEIIWKFPIGYQQKFSDAFNNSSTNGQAIAGEKTVEVDGYGTLKTAAGTFPNTLRMKVTQNIVLTSPLGGHTTSTVFYVWMNKHYKGGLLLQILFSETTMQGETAPSGGAQGLMYTKPEPL